MTYEHAQPVESFFESLPHDAQVHESPHLQSALDVHEHDVTLLWWTAIPLQRTTDAEGRYRSRRHRGDGRRGEQ